MNSYNESKTMNKNNENIEMFSIFGLTENQTSLLFSFERQLVLNDIEETSNEADKILKRKWLDEWLKSIKYKFRIISEQRILISSFKVELSNSNINTWYFIILLEMITFNAYFPLTDDKNVNKVYEKLKYKNQNKFIKKIVSLIGHGTPETVERYYKMYNMVIEKATGKNNKILINILITTAVAAIAAATAGIFAGPLAVLLVGGMFPTLHGAALVSACLAYIGGGAIAAGVGGAGMAGGIMVIAGGGAILGTAAGGGLTIGFSALAKNSSEFTLTHAAKLSVVLREIILTEQKDIKTAQAIIKSFKEEIGELQKEISNLKLENSKDKIAYNNLKKSVEYMENIFKDSNAYTSSFIKGVANGKN